MSEHMTKQEAFNILNLSPSTPRAKVKLRYENLMRDAKFNDAVSTELITKAYDVITDVEWTSYDPGVYSEKGLNKKKIINFFYHYKWTVIIVFTAVFILITSIILFIADYSKPDYYLTIVGGSVIHKPDLADEHFSEILGVDEVQLDVFTVGAFADGEIGASGMMWLLNDLTGGDSSLYLLSSEFAKFLSYEGAATDLTPLLNKLGIPLTDERIIWWYNEDGHDIAAGFRFGNYPDMDNFVSGYKPDCFSIPFRVKITKQTEILVTELINNTE